MSVQISGEGQHKATHGSSQSFEFSENARTGNRTLGESKITNLHFDGRNNCFYLKMKTPKRFKHVYRREHIRRSLSTCNYGVAAIRVTEKRNQVIDELEALLVRGKVKNTKSTTVPKTEHHLLEAHIPAIIHNFKTAALSADQKTREMMGDDDLDTYCENIEHELKNVTRTLARMKFKEFLPLTRELLNKEKLTSPANKTLEMLTEAVAIAQGDILKTIKKRNQGEFADLHNRTACIEARGLPTLRDALIHWTQIQSNDKTIQAHQNCVAEFESIAGNVPLASISGATVECYASKLVDKQLSGATIRNRVGYLHAMVSRYVEYIKRTESDPTVMALKLGKQLIDDDNPFIKTHLPLVKNKDSEKKRQPFEVDDAQQILNTVQISESEIGGTSTETLEFGMFVKLAFFTGARCEELAQLRASDLIYVHGHPCLHLHNKDGNTLKTTSSARKLPLHAELINGGVLEFLQSKLDEGSDTLLFNAIVGKSKDGKKGGAIGKRFERLLKKLGLKQPGLCLHSARYNAKQALTSSGCNAQATNAYFGHWDRSSSGIYMSEKGGLFNTSSLISAIKSTVFPYYISPK